MKKGLMDFDTDCRYFPSKTSEWMDSPVWCNEYRKTYCCDKCGWNPQVKKQRLVKMFGVERAKKLNAFLSVPMSEAQEAENES